MRKWMRESKMVDYQYFEKKLKLVIRDIKMYTHKELRTELSRLAEAANLENLGIQPAIKPINEHEWSDDFISSVLRFANPSHVSIYLDDGAHGSVDLSIDDLKALSKSLGYDMVKRQSGGVSDER